MVPTKWGWVSVEGSRVYKTYRHEVTGHSKWFPYWLALLLCRCDTFSSRWLQGLELQRLWQRSGCQPPLEETLKKDHVVVKDTLTPTKIPLCQWEQFYKQINLARTINLHWERFWGAWWRRSSRLHRRWSHGCIETNTGVNSNSEASKVLTVLVVNGTDIRTNTTKARKILRSRSAYTRSAENTASGPLKQRQHRWLRVTYGQAQDIWTGWVRRRAFRSLGIDCVRTKKCIGCSTVSGATYTCCKYWSAYHTFLMDQTDKRVNGSGLNNGTCCQ